MNSAGSLYIGADLGGTKIRTAVFDRELRIQYVDQVSSAANGGRDRVLATLEAALAQAFDWVAKNKVAVSVDGVGISTAGIVDSRNGVILDATDAISGWRGTPLAAWLQGKFRTSVVVENDVNCALQGELSVDSTLNSQRVVMLTLGTGLGGALADRGRIISGAHAAAGHFGRMPVPSPWEPGAIVPLESLVSGSGLANITSHLNRAREFTDGRSVLEASAAGETHALMGLDRFCDFLVMVLEQQYWALDPDIFLIGGGLIEAQDQWWPLLNDKLSRCPLPISVQPARLNSDAGVQGAAALIRAAMEPAENVYAN
ncbi:ROK family protein [Microbulbifer sp. TYP-18]|uniref:ROK family protein n=1 Tax=Microbulbifer sp. TYP-18 TaxID=3230024 RepID=UPI0034C6D2D6